MDLVPGAMFGKYRLEKRLGGGSFGSVWRAIDTETQAIVALKILSGTYSESDGAQLRADVELLAAAAAAGSKHVVRVLGGGLDPSPHVVMEYLEGTDLAATLQARGKLPQSEVVEIGEAVADALAALVAVGIIHRDVKPANIMLCSDGSVKLTDFGIAKIVGFDTLTSTGQLPLTMAYAAPEVWDGKASGASDVYALGCVLYQSATGILPFSGSYSEVYRGHMSRTPDYSVLPPDTTPALRSLIEDCLAKESADRPSSPEAVIARLRDARAEIEERRGAPGGHPPIAFGPWLLVAPHPTRQWAWGARHEKTGERAIVEICFGPSVALGEHLRRAVEANQALVPLGAERLLGTNRLILRPDEAWPVPPPSGPFAFWVAREELPTPPPAPLAEPALRRVLGSLGVLKATAMAAGVRLDLGPTALVALPDGTIHVRRPGLPPDTTLEPDAAALETIKRMPLDPSIAARVSGTLTLGDLKRHLGLVDAPAPEATVVGAPVAVMTTIVGQEDHGVEATGIGTRPDGDVVDESEFAGRPTNRKLSVLPKPRADSTLGGRDRRARRRRAVIPAFVMAALVVLIAAYAAYGAFERAAASPSAPSVAGGASMPGATAIATTLEFTVGPGDTSPSVDSTVPPTNGLPASQATAHPTLHAPGSGTPPPQRSTPTATPYRQITVPPQTWTQSPTQGPTWTAGPTAVPTPAAPSGTYASAQDPSSVLVTWFDNSDNETAFEINNGSANTNVSADVTSYTWTGLGAGSTTCFKVRALNSFGASAWSSTSCAKTPVPVTQPPTPTPPSNITATAQSKSNIWIGWSDNSNNETGFEITDGSTTKSVGANTASYVWSGLGPGTNKCFQVRAVNGSYASGWMGPACATTVANVYCATSTNITIYSGTNFTGSTVSYNYPAGSGDHVINLPWTPRSFTDPGSASHVVVIAGLNGNGNPNHYESAQSDISNISGQSSVGWSFNAYVKVCN